MQFRPDAQPEQLAEENDDEDEEAGLAKFRAKPTKQAETKGSEDKGADEKSERLMCEVVVYLDV